MNKYQEALNTLTDWFHSYTNENGITIQERHITPEYVKAKKIIQELVDKETPKKPIIIKTDYMEAYCCPNERYKIMKIKGFDENLKCRGFQFEIGKEYKIDTEGRPLELCTDTVFHYCNSLQQVHKFYDVNDNNRFCEIEVLGEEISDYEKCGSNHIKIVREIVGEELEVLKGHINGNSGLFNSGDNNSGNWNSGYWNSGNYNSGNYNSGNYNSGDNNSGYHNSGYWNSGSCNSGNYNSGNNNSGYLNSGYWNSGNYNSGNNNSGYWNSGDWNKCNYSNGFFNTKEPTVNIFNKDSGMTAREFNLSKYYDALIYAPFILTEWVNYTKEEMENDEKKKLIGGYLKTYSYEEACLNWWKNTPKKYRKIIMQIPNFDKEIFKEITGIDVDKGIEARINTKAKKTKKKGKGKKC